MSKVIKDGKVAVLYSPEFGAGWSTWRNNPDDNDFLLTDSTLIDMAMNNCPVSVVEEYLERIGIDTYTGGWPCAVKWVPIGARYLIHEYDGSEGVWILDEMGQIMTGDNDE